MDRRGKMTMPEFDAMLRMLYASQDADPDLVRLLAVNGSGDADELSFEEFLAVSKTIFVFSELIFVFCFFFCASTVVTVIAIFLHTTA